MPAGQAFFPLRGGLDQETPAIGIPPGRAIGCLNHEAVPNGYQRTQGFERYSGRAAPSDARFYTIPFTTGVTAFVAGETVTGFTSGATGRVLDVAQLSSGTFGGGNAAGRVAITALTGNFQAGELLKVGGVTRATAASIQLLGDYHAGALELSWLVAAQTYYRNLITPLDTVGGVRGILIKDNTVYAFADNTGEGRIYTPTPTGWSQLDLKTQLLFTGGAFQPVAGPSVASTLTGVTSGATAKCRAIFLDNGTYAGGDAKGVYIIDTLVGNFTAGEQVRVGAGQIAGIATVGQTVVSLSVGGEYDFELYNFTTGNLLTDVWCVNGIDKAFQFNGQYIGFFSSGMVTLDSPTKVAEHKNQLFLTFGDRIQGSVVGKPRLFDGTLGATDIGVGADITNVIANTEDAMLIFTTNRLYALTGNDSSDFVLSPQGGNDTGAKEYSAQRIGQVVYLDNRGIRSAAMTQLYGNFRLGSFTSLIQKEINAKATAGVRVMASAVVKLKSQYLLFFSDGSGISIFFGLKQPEAMLFKYPFIVAPNCIAVGEINSIERVFVGATNGYVYELNKGTSFDGAAIDAFVQLPYAHQGDPRLLKRYQSIDLDLDADPGSQIGLLTRFDFGNSEQPYNGQDTATVMSAMGTASMAGGVVTWATSQVGNVHYPIDGMGANMSAIFVSSSSTMPSYTLSGITVAFRPRGRKR